MKRSTIVIPLLLIGLYADTLTQPYLLGDGNGIRKTLTENGIDFKLWHTSIYQGLDIGVR